MSLERWRLILGSAAEPAAPLPPGRGAEVDTVLSAVYGGGASLDPSRPSIPRDLADALAKIRELFPRDVATIVQADALERRGWSRLLAEPEVLGTLDRNLDLVRFILAAKDSMPARARDLAREIVREVASRLRERLETGTRSSIVGALRRRPSPVPVAANVDWRRSIERNLKNWIPDRRILIPERIHFRTRELRRRDWTLILLVDQSASMAESLIHSSIVASVFASLQLLRTHLLLFDASVVDMTPHLEDPVDILFGARLGGGTDIARALAHAARLVETPERTIVVLVTDLREGGEPSALRTALERLAHDRVQTLCVLALSDDGRALYDPDVAREVAALGIPAFACTPRALVDAVSHALAGGAR